MTEPTEERVPLQPTEEQKLRLQLAQRDCQLNYAKRCQADSEERFYQLTFGVAESMLPRLQAERAELEREANQLGWKFYEVAQQIKAENGWADAVQWDASTLTYSAPAENGWMAVAEEAREGKVRIQ